MKIRTAPLRTGAQTPKRTNQNFFPYKPGRHYKSRFYFFKPQIPTQKIRLDSTLKKTNPAHQNFLHSATQAKPHPQKFLNSSLRNPKPASPSYTPLTPQKSPNPNPPSPAVQPLDPPMVDPERFDAWKSDRNYSTHQEIDWWWLFPQKRGNVWSETLEWIQNTEKISDRRNFVLFYFLFEGNLAGLRVWASSQDGWQNYFKVEIFWAKGDRGFYLAHKG